MRHRRISTVRTSPKQVCRNCLLRQLFSATSAAVETGPARSAHLIAGPDHYEIQVDVRRTAGDESDHVGDVLGHQWGNSVVDLCGTLLVAVEPEQREVRLHHA